MTPLLMLACAGAPSSLLAPTLSSDRWTQAALLPAALTVCPGTGDFETIQEAIDAATDGDTIEVCAGTYDEDLVIEKPLTLIDDGGMTTIDGSGTTSVVSIDAAGLVTIEGFVIQGGAATHGGGIYAPGPRLILDLRDNVVQRNTATGMGGGVYIGSARGLFTENVFQLNVADMGGGIASIDGTVTIQGNDIRRNDCTTTDTTVYGAGGGGAGVFVQGGARVIDNWIHGNDSTLHGGGGFFYSAYDEISLNRVHDNTSVGDGAGFYFWGSPVYAVSGNELYLNHAGDDGGAMYAAHAGMLIQDNHFHDNDAAGDGGALQLLSLDAISIVRSNTFEYNVAGDRGGALQLDNNDLQRISRSTFIGNRAARGGALHSRLGLRSTWLSEMTFEGNSATECGGAIAFDNQPAPFLVEVATFTGNTARNGAAFCMTHEWTDDAMTEADRSGALFMNVLLVDNVASSASGAFHVEFGSVDVYYSTIVGAGRGTVSVGDGDSISITRTIFADGMGPFATVDGSGQVEITSSLFWNNRGGWGDIGMPIGFRGNIAGDPLFVDPANGDFSLDPSSPASGAAPTGTDIGKTGGRLGW